MQCIRKGFVKKLRLLKVKTRIGVIIKFQLIRKIMRGKKFRVGICFANFVKCKQGAYSQNGYNGLFSSDVYLGAAVVV